MNFMKVKTFVALLFTHWKSVGLVSESGHIYSFGSNSDGQLGYEGVTDQYLPKHIESLRPTKYKILSAGADNSVALTGNS